MWKRLEAVEQKKRAVLREKAVITSCGLEEKKEVDALVERWMSGEPMERFGGVYDEERIVIIRVNAVAPGEV
jgi:hypothetical protein